MGAGRPLGDGGVAENGWLKKRRKYPEDGGKAIFQQRPLGFLHGFASNYLD